LAPDHEGAGGCRAVVGPDGDGPGAHRLTTPVEGHGGPRLLDDDHLVEGRGRDRRPEGAQLELDPVADAVERGTDLGDGRRPVDRGTVALGGDAEGAAGDVEGRVLGGDDRSRRHGVDDATERLVGDLEVDARQLVAARARSGVEGGGHERLDGGRGAELAAGDRLAAFAEGDRHRAVERHVDGGTDVADHVLGELGGDGGLLGVERDAQLVDVPTDGVDERGHGFALQDLATPTPLDGDGEGAVDPVDLGVARFPVEILGDPGHEGGDLLLGHGGRHVDDEPVGRAEPAQPDEVGEPEVVARAAASATTASTSVVAPSCRGVVAHDRSPCVTVMVRSRRGSRCSATAAVASSALRSPTSTEAIVVPGSSWPPSRTVAP
jgi:hypothetical protein